MELTCLRVRPPRGHRGTIYEGKHEAIIDEGTWDAVQAMLTRSVQGQQRAATVRIKSLLAGKVFDQAGEPLVASHACKGKVRYRCYASRALPHEAGAADRSEGLRIPALELAKAVALRVAQIIDDPLQLMGEPGTLPTPEELHVANQRAKKVTTEDASDTESVGLMAPDCGLTGDDSFLSEQ